MKAVRLLFFIMLLWSSFPLTAAHAIEIKVNQVTLIAPVSAANSFTVVNFRQTYVVPPLVFVLPTNQGLEPASVRIRNVTTTGFEAVVVEPTGADGTHPGMTFDYIAVSPGVHTLPDGTVIEAGSIATSNTVQSTAGSVWSPVTFTNVFLAAPTVQTQIQTVNNEPAMIPGSVSVPWLTSVAQLITTTGFQTALERSETTALGTVALPETIAYLAFPNVSGSFLDNAGTTISYQSLNSTNSIRGHDNGCYTTAFTPAYTLPPIVVANKITRNGSDGGWLRRCSLATTAVGLHVEEDTAVDAERAHIAETASIVSFSQAFDLSLVGGGIEAGSITTPASLVGIASWTHVSFPNSFSTPPLVFALPTNEGAAPASLRLRNITTAGFDIAAFEPLNELGAHPSMTVSYIAIVPGTHTLANGDIFEAGTIVTAAQHFGTGNPGTSTWATLAFSNVHPTIPSVITQIQSINNEAALDPNNVSIPFETVASRNITTANMQIAIERSEAGGFAGVISAETIAYLAVASSSIGSFKDTSGTVISYEAIRSANNIRGWDNGCFTTPYLGVYATPPLVVANKATLFGGDGGWMRECSRTNLAIGLTLDEDRALNAERSHTNEIASILLFDKAFEASFSPFLTVTKSSSVTTVAPLGIVGYTIAVQNIGNTLATAVNLDDAMSQYTGLIMDTYGVNTPFLFTDSVLSPSGLTAGVSSYSFNNGLTFTYTPATTGTDNNVTNWRMPMVGSMNAGGQFTIDYQVRVK